MFDAMSVLGALLENQAAPSAAGRLTAAAQQGAGSGGLQDILGSLMGGGGQGGGGAAGGLGGLLGGLLGGQQQQPQQQQGGGGLADILGGLLGGGAQGGAGGGLGSLAGALLGGGAGGQGGAGGGLGSLAGALLGGGQGAMGGGLMAVLAGLAHSTLGGGGAGAMPAAAEEADNAPAMEKVSSKDGAAVPAHLQAMQDPQAAQRKATLLLRAMIEAAKADGQIDQTEMDRITGNLDKNPEARNFVMQELSRPLDLAGLCREVTSPHEAVEVYGASLMTVEADSPAEQNYLAQLAAALGLSDDVVAKIHQQLGLNA